MSLTIGGLSCIIVVQNLGCFSVCSGIHRSVVLNKYGDTQQVRNNNFTTQNSLDYTLRLRKGNAGLL